MIFWLDVAGRRSSCRACEAAFGGEAVANPVRKVFLTHRDIRFHDGFAAERSLAGSAAATGRSFDLKTHNDRCCG
jgi:hypothetical protein